MAGLEVGHFPHLVHEEFGLLQSCHLCPNRTPKISDHFPQLGYFATIISHLVWWISVVHGDNDRLVKVQFSIGDSFIDFHNVYSNLEILLDGGQ